MARTTLAIHAPFAEYIRAVTLREPAVLKRLREETARLPDPDMQIAPEQGQFMGLLARMLGARRTLEIGVFTGYSSISVALALPEDGRLIACDVSEEWTSIARRYWREAGVERKIDLRLRPAIETLDELIGQGEGGTFDFAFIDADKMMYPRYYERCLALLRPGGAIAIDNVLWHGAVFDDAKTDSGTVSMRRFNQTLHQDERIALSMLPIGDGLTLAMKK